MAIREIVHIDEELCDGCGDCVPSCAEGAIRIINGKAKLVADNLCDGLGACLGHCPQDAIKVEKREADHFDEEAVERHLARSAPAPAPIPMAGPAPTPLAPMSGGCPGSRMQHFADAPAAAAPAPATAAPGTALRQWPVQLHLVPPTAPFFQNADVLLAADCAAFAVADFHDRFLAGKGLAIACPKLDQGQEIYLQKLVAMIDEARINTLTVMVMEVPCCTGLVGLAQEAAARATRKVPVKRVIIGTRGDVLAEDWC